MDTILKVIDGVTTDGLVKSIINSLNENQEKSKDWLIEKSKQYFTFFNNPSVVVAAGWYGHLANKINDNIYTTGEIVSFDKDPQCRVIGKKLYKDVKDITFTTAEIEYFNFKNYDIVICTSCEHLKQEVIDDMIIKIKPGALVILQSNNFNFEIEDHINCHNNVEEFKQTLKLEKILYKGTLNLGEYDRYMVIGI